MARATWTGSISLGLLNVPIKMFTANREEKVAFRTVEKATGQPIKMPYVSTVDGSELDRSLDVLKRYEFADGQTVDVTKDDIASVQPAKSRVMQLSGFVPTGNIDPSLFSTSHQVGPDKGGEVGLELLSGAMWRKNVVGIGTYVKSGNERLFCIRPHGDQVFLHELYWADEVREPVNAVNPNGPLLDVELLNMADDLVGNLSVDWHHEMYINKHRAAVLEMLERKSGGVDPVAPVEEAPASPGDLMAALEASVAAAKAVKAS